MVVAALSTVLFRPAPREPVGSTRLPQFSLALLEGNGSVSSSDLAGSPVVLNFWASWCGPCRDEAPAFEAAWRRYEDDGVKFLGVNVCDLEPEAEAFVDEFDITYPIVRDPDQKLADALGIECALPQTFFVDATGAFLATSVRGDEAPGGGGRVVLGGIEPEDLAARIEELLATEADA